MPIQMIAGGGVLVAEVSEVAIAGVSVGAVEEVSMVESLDGVKVWIRKRCLVLAGMD